MVTKVTSPTGGQAIPSFDYLLAPGVKKSFVSNFIDVYEIITDSDLTEMKGRLRGLIKVENSILDNKEKVKDVVKDYDQELKHFNRAWERATTKTVNQTYQSMESLVSNFNTMHSRSGSQVPFSSINLGMNRTPEGRMIIKNFLLAVERGLGKNETAVFPISIFKVKDGVNFKKGDKNYDLYRLAMRVTAQRLFPNFEFLDAPFNLQYYIEDDYRTHVDTMGCRTRVMGNINGEETSVGRGNLSFSSINLVRCALEAKGDITKFYKNLDRMLELVTEQLLHRYKIQCSKTVRNFPFLMGQGLWMGSENLKPDDTLESVLKHGTLGIGKIGLAETLVALTGKHHGESEDSQKLGLEIEKHMRDFTDRMTKKHGLNFSLLATPAEGLAGKFVEADRKLFGIIPGVTDKEFYTNSSHVPVDYKISAYDKIRIEAPYHAYDNGGHICYIEVDGDISNNLDAMESLLACMKEQGVGYGAINHPVDYHPECHFSGVINDECPSCGKHVTDDDVIRIRRITGYLVDDLNRWGNAKRAEEKARVKHSL